MPGRYSGLLLACCAALALKGESANLASTLAVVGQVRTQTLREATPLGTIICPTALLFRGIKINKIKMF